MSAIDGHGVPQLGGVQRVVIVEHRVIIPNDVGIMDGSLLDPQSTRHLRVIDLVKNTALYMPLNAAQINQLRKALS